MDLLAFPDDVLITDLFPWLDLKSLSQLALTCSRFRQLFEERSHWRTRSRKEFPESTRIDPAIGWQNYYRFHMTSSSVPLYYHGDIVARCPFDKDHLEISLELIWAHRPSDDVNIIFLGQSAVPIMSIDELSNQRIQKILFLEPSQSKEDESLHELILSELISPLGTPPIYGSFIYGPEERALVIFDRRNGGEANGIGWDRLSDRQKSELFELLGEETSGDDTMMDKALSKIGHIF